MSFKKVYVLSTVDSVANKRTSKQTNEQVALHENNNEGTTVGKFIHQLCRDTSSSVAYCEIAYEKGWTNGTNCCQCTKGTTYHPNEKAKVIVDCLEESSLLMTCVTKTMSDTWRLQSKLSSHL
jgi:hypothetical protein